MITKKKIEKIAVRAALISLSVLTLAGCGTDYTPAMDIKKAVIFGPHGEFEFKTVKSESSMKRRPRWTTSVYDGQYGFIIRFFPTSASNGSIVIVSDTNDIKVDMKPSFYQFNGGKKQDLHLKSLYVGWHYSGSFTNWWHKAHSITNKGPELRYSRSRLEILSPPTQASRYGQSGGSTTLLGPGHSMHFIDEAHLKKIAKEWYHYYIRFSVNGEPYTMDVTFRLRIDMSTRFGVPGG